MEEPMNNALKGKNAIVTGAGKKTGIGYAIAYKLASCGANVIIADLGHEGGEDNQVKTGTRNEMEEIVSELEQTFSVNALAISLDVTRPDSIAAMVEQVSGFCKHLHVLCNNAGASFGVPNTVQNYDEPAWMKTIDVNLHSVFRVTRALLPFMMEEGASIINTASRAGKVPALFNGAYAVAKAGVIMLSKVMALELAGNRIRVNAIEPGWVETPGSTFFLTPEELEHHARNTIPASRSRSTMARTHCTHSALRLITFCIGPSALVLPCMDADARRFRRDPSDRAVYSRG